MDILFLVFPFFVLILSAILHEIAHGWVADKLGDPTARLLGRLTLNPIPHIDPIMSILMPAVLLLSGSPIIFGAAKPVPVNPLHFEDQKKDMALTALAGPLTNLVLAIICAMLFRFLPENIILHSFLKLMVIYNLMLCFLNLIPIPPLDGSKVIASILPDEASSAYLSIGQYGTFILLFLLLFPIGPISFSSLLNQLIMYSIQLLGL